MITRQTALCDTLSHAFLILIIRGCVDVAVSLTDGLLNGLSRYLIVHLIGAEAEDGNVHSI